MALWYDLLFFQEGGNKCSVYSNRFQTTSEKYTLVSVGTKNSSLTTIKTFLTRYLWGYRHWNCWFVALGFQIKDIFRDRMDFVVAHRLFFYFGHHQRTSVVHGRFRQTSVHKSWAKNIGSVTRLQRIGYAAHAQRLQASLTSPL